MRSFVSTFPIVRVFAISALSAFAGAAVACSSSRTITGVGAPDGSSPAIAEPADGGDSGLPTTEHDGGADAAVVTPSDGGCVIQYLDQCPQEDVGCDALISLRNGREFCTLSCESPAECPKGAGLVCNPEFGACLPECTEDAFCKAVGFFRCDTVGKTCTTL